MADVPPLVQRIPDGERNAEEALAADAPIAREAIHPVLEARAHVGRVPFELASPRDQRLAVIQRADEPLPAGDDLNRALALLKELHRVRQRLGLALQLARLVQQLDRPAARLVDRLALQLGVL